MTHTDKIHAKRLMFILALLILPIMIIGCAEAINPHTTADVTSNGLIITSIFPDSIKQNNNYTFFWYVQNQTNSAFMNNSFISCTFEVYKSTGFNGIHILDIKGTFDGIEEWSAFVGPGNFSLIGEYFERIKCNSTINTGSGGIVESTFDVTPNGNIPQNISIAAIFGIAFISMILLGIAYIWNERQLLLKSLFISLSLLVDIILAQAIYNMSKYQYAINDSIIAVGSIQTLLIAVIILLILFMSITLLINVFKTWKNVKRQKKERNENEIV